MVNGSGIARDHRGELMVAIIPGSILRECAVKPRLSSAVLGGSSVNHYHMAADFEGSLMAIR